MELFKISALKPVSKSKIDFLVYCCKAIILQLKNYLLNNYYVPYWNLYSIK